jgi:hypothetical protein
MYAKIKDQTTKEVIVGSGTNIAFYKSLGMTEMDVEQAYNGRWYVAGYAPEKPEPTAEEKIAALDAQYNADKTDLLTAYQTAQIYGDTETMVSLTADLQSLDEQYDEDYEQIVGEE